MKTVNKIIGISSIVMGFLCLLPSIIGIFAGIAIMTEDEFASRVIATVLFEVFIFIGGGIARAIPSKPIAILISSALLIIAGILQITYIAEFSLKFIGAIFVLILSWVAVICILFGIVLFTSSMIAIFQKNKTNQK